MVAERKRRISAAWNQINCMVAGCPWVWNFAHPLWGCCNGSQKGLLVGRNRGATASSATRKWPWALLTLKRLAQLPQPCRFVLLPFADPPALRRLSLPSSSVVFISLTHRRSLGLNCDSPLSPLLFLLPSSFLFSSSSSSSGSGGSSPGTAPWCEG